jgi:hypothetical protein
MDINFKEEWINNNIDIGEKSIIARTIPAVGA